MKKQIMILLFLLNMFFGVVLLSAFSNANSKYTTIETLCDADTHVSDHSPNTNFGDNQIWRAGIDEYNNSFIYFLHFNFSDKPKSYETVKIQLSLLVLRINLPIVIFQNWNESDITWNNKPFPNMLPEIPPFSLFYNNRIPVIMFINVEKYIGVLDDITISIGYNHGEYNGFISGYSREYPNQDLVPKLIWTIRDNPDTKISEFSIIIGLIIGIPIGIGSSIGILFIRKYIKKRKDII